MSQWALATPNMGEHKRLMRESDYHGDGWQEDLVDIGSGNALNLPLIDHIAEVDVVLAVIGPPFQRPNK